MNISSSTAPVWRTSCAHLACVACWTTICLILLLNQFLVSPGFSNFNYFSLTVATAFYSSHWFFSTILFYNTHVVTILLFFNSSFLIFYFFIHLYFFLSFLNFFTFFMEKSFLRNSTF